MSAIFVVTTGVRNVIEIEWVEAREAAEHCAVCRTMLHDEDVSCSDCQ